MKVLILTADSNGGYPVPAVRGGAVSTLIQHLVAGNNEKKLCDMEILSFYDLEAQKKALEEYPNVQFSWVKVPKVFKLLDKCTFNFVRVVKKNEKAISFRSLFTLLYYIRKARKIVNRTDADKIIIENNIPLVRVMKNSIFKGQWYYHFHNIPRIDAGCRKEFQKVTKFLCVSQFVADQITSEKSAIGKIVPEKISVFYNCINTKLFKPISKNDFEIRRLKCKYGIKDSDYVLVFTGRLSEEKGPDIVLEVMKQLPHNVKSLIVGSLIYNTNINSPFQEKLHDLASTLGERVVFTGYIDQQKLPYLYNLADVAVLPSIWDEPAGLTNIEAMACGVPVITTDSGGVPEYVGKSKIVKRDAQIINNIVRCIDNLMCDKDEYENIREFGIGYIEDNFSKENYIDKFVKAINV